MVGRPAPCHRQPHPAQSGPGGQGGRKPNGAAWTGLPLLAGEPIPKGVEWWPWQVEGLALKPAAASEWLSRLPLSGDHPDLADDLR